MLEQLGDFGVDLLTIILSPEYGAEAIKVGAVYLLFRKDIKDLGKKVLEIGEKLAAHIDSTDSRIDVIENHLGFNNRAEKRPEGAKNGDTTH